MAHAIVGTALGALGTVAVAGLVVVVAAGLVVAPVLAGPTSPVTAAGSAPTPRVEVTPAPEPESFAEQAPITSMNGRESQEAMTQEEQDYLDHLYDDTYVSHADLDLITWAWESCAGLYDGYAVWEVEEYLLGYDGVTYDQAFDIAYEARSWLCPQYASV